MSTTTPRPFNPLATPSAEPWVRPDGVKVTPLWVPHITRPRKFIRKLGTDRRAGILAMVDAGETNPAVIAKAEQCSKELILYYARRMEEVRVEAWKPGPHMRRRMRIVRADAPVGDDVV